MRRHTLLLLLALTQACIFSEEASETGSAPDMSAADMSPDLSGADLGPDLISCPTVACEPGCLGQSLTVCTMVDGCLSPQVSACAPNTELCDVATLSCIPNPCGGVVQILCDPEHPDKYTSCEMNASDGLITPRPLTCYDGKVCDAANESGCSDFSCKEEDQRSCIDASTQGVCVLVDGQLTLQQTPCDADELCDGARCKPHECSEEQLKTGATRCLPSPNDETLNIEQTCVLNNNARRVWGQAMACGALNGCSESEQRCLRHECSTEQLGKSYCLDGLNGKQTPTSCALDGAHRKQTKEEACRNGTCVDPVPPATQAMCLTR
jgi:hypothetical protein